MAESKYGYIKDNKVFRNAFLDFDAREIGEVKETDELALTYFEERFQQASKQVDDVKAKIDGTENKGSYLMKVLHLKETLCDFDALGDFESLYAILEELHVQLQTIIDANRHKNLQIKTALLEQLEVVAKSSDWKVSSATVKEIQSKWLKTGAITEDKREQVEGQFKSLVDSFYERRAAFYEDLNQMMAQKEKDFESFVKDVNSRLQKIDSSRTLQTEIKSVIEQWKGLGKIERSKHNDFWNELQSVFKSHTNRIRKSESKVRNMSNEEVLKQKQEILDQLEKDSKNIVPNTDLKVVKDTWKKAGRLPKKQDLEFAHKYRFLLDVISEKQFLNQLLNKKGGRANTEADKNKLRIKLMYDLLRRDQNELSNFEENLGKFNTSSGLNEMLEAKLDQQKRKVKIKKSIIDELKASN